MMKDKIYGPYLRKDGRQHLIIVKSGKRKTISYPKWIMEKHINRKFIKNETVDHIDGNPLNNNISNLRLLSRKENSRIAIKPAKEIELECICCGKIFNRRKVVEERRINKLKNDGPFCSNKCVGKVYH